MSAKRKGWRDAAIQEASDEWAAANAREGDMTRKASNYQVAMGRIEILAERLIFLDMPDRNQANEVDAYAGAIWALARLAQKENEI